VFSRALTWIARPAAPALALLVLAVAVLGCDDEALAPRQIDAGAPFGLTAEQAAAVLARVGDRTITLGDYALTLERMNADDRQRYQSKKRRRDLLQEMIDVELLAQEATRRGLDKNPDVQDAIRGILRDAMRGKIQDTVRPPGEIPSDDVKAYYDAHQDQFAEPERRRVAAIVVTDEAKAKESLEKVLAMADDKEWGKLFNEYSLTAPKTPAKEDPPELAGDLGMVGPPDDPRGDNSKVPAAVRKVAFETLDKVGDVHDKLVQVGERFFIVRLIGITAARTRSLEMSERAIRMTLYQELQRKAEADAADMLRKKFNVTIDEKALGEIKLPDAMKDYQPFWDEDAPVAPSASAPPAPSSSAPAPQP
jgi:peptidyl-prolyl cis-trans isomerase C